MRPAAVAVAILMTTVAFVSGTPISSGADAESETCLRIGFLDRVDSLNPNVGLTQASKLFYSLVYDRLQGVGEDLEAVPNLALDWRIAEEFEPYGSVWEFNLTENAYWHDGAPLTAEDIAFTMNTMSENYVQMWMYHPYTYYMDYAEKVTDYSIRLHFYDRNTTDPMPAAYAEMLCIPIFPKHIIEKMDIAEFGFNWIGATEGHDPPIVGSGPFMVTDDIIEEFTTGDRITLVKNPSYHWKADRGIETQLDRIEMWFFDNGTVLAEALEDGTIDVAELPRDDYLAMKERIDEEQLQDITIFDSPSPDQHSTYISVSQSPLGSNPSIVDPIIKQALAHATDKEYIVDNHYLGLADEGATLITPINEFWHYEPTPDEYYEYDPDLAAQMLEDAGYRYVSSSEVREATADSYAVQSSLVTEGTKLKYHMTVRQEYPEDRLIALYLQEKWAEIGVNLEYDVASESVMWAYSLCVYVTDLWIWSPRWDVDPMCQLFHQTKYSFGGWNDNQYTRPDYEENFSLSVQSLDADQRREYVHNCQKIHYEDIGYIILAELRQTYAWRTDSLSGWGDWEAHPGRSIDATWTGNVLYFELEPHEEDGQILILASAAIAAVVAGAVTALVVRSRRRR